MGQLLLVFPFKIDNKEIFYSFETNIERKENVVSFSLKYKFELYVKGVVQANVSKFQNLFLYVFKFEDLNKAMDFIDSRKCNVIRGMYKDSVEELKEEVNEFMLAYEDKENKKSKKRRVLVEGEDGFMKYV